MRARFGICCIVFYVNHFKHVLFSTLSFAEITSALVMNLFAVEALVEVVFLRIVFFLQTCSL